MLSIGKSTTQAWSKAPQESSLKGDPTKHVAANLANPFGDKTVGEIANEVVDPNYVDPNAVTREKKADLDKDAFFKLMLAQMKNQDPTNPMQSHEMAAQLAQFTSMEQLFNVNKNLEAIKQTAEPQSGYEAVNFIGKSVVSDASRVVRTPNDKEHDLRFSLGGDASETKVNIKDMNNQVVKVLTFGALKKGENKVVWNGVTETGQKAREGEYLVEIEARSSNNHKIGVETKVAGKITGVNFTSKGPVLMIGNQSVYMKDIKKIEDSDMRKEQEAKGKPVAIEKVETAPGGLIAPMVTKDTMMLPSKGGS